MKKAWQLERELRDAAVPVDRRVNVSHYSDEDGAFKTVPAGDDLIRLFWDSKVPGSWAPEIPYMEMVQAAYTKGIDTREAEKLLPKGLELYRAGNIVELRALTAELLETLNTAPIDPKHPFHTFEHPEEWADVRNAMGNVQDEPYAIDRSALPERIYQGWLGQLSGGSFGTALEGYTGAQLAKMYGEVREYIAPPETTNDDVVYELAFLDVFERLGKNLTSRDLGLEWIKQIPFGWSAEWVALRDLSMGIFPPYSGSFQKSLFQLDRGADAWHDLWHADTRLADGSRPPGSYRRCREVITTTESYGEIYAAVLTSLAFARLDLHEILQEAAEYIPQKSLYASVVRDSIQTSTNRKLPRKPGKCLKNITKNTIGSMRIQTSLR